MTTTTKSLRRVETKINDGPSVYLLLYHNSPVYFVHGAYSSENKILAELRKLGKLPENRLSPAQKRENSRAKAKKLSPVHQDPMDCYHIREITVT